MISANPEGKLPKISKNAYIHPSSVIVGDVQIGKNVFVGPFAVIRADELQSSISIGDNCNVQDGVIIHALAKTSVKVSTETSLSHGCLIHGPVNIGSNCFIGFKSIVFNTTILDNVFVGHGAIIEGVAIAANQKVASGSKINTNDTNGISSIDIDSVEFNKKVLAANQYLVNGYHLETYAKPRTQTFIS